ncbi:hypothetical protein NLJ89_g4307 [Agrocybe chaxingu]|uniref:Uncharacterized protein n=1 Tax=Agrocybe chaxingu TaxID=84603 RepID=A0A9W8K491_9AGAR|nr:hypothetical protein NLJ89_g4307 [Agrocybe chaxingu]
MRSGGSSRVPSPASSPRMSRAVLRHGEHAEGTNGDHPLHPQVSHGSALLAAQRILALATESLDMMRNVTGVVKESLDKADAWVGRLRTVGIQRGAQEGEDDADGSELDFPPSSSHRMRHRRTDSSQSAYDDQDIGSGMPSPFFSGASTNWGSSIPSTPGGAYTPVNSSFSYAGNASSPGAIHIPIGSMSLGSRYNTPKSAVVGLPDEEEEGEDEAGRRVEKMEVVNTKPVERAGGVKVVGVDAGIEEDGERGIQKMDVDV